MPRLGSALCRLVLGIGLVLASALPGGAAEMDLRGAWTATKAERDGKAADDVVGHRLSFAGDHFELVAPDGAPLYAGTVRVDASAAPPAIDFEHTEGELAGKVWKGIFRIEGDALTICDNAPDMERGEGGGEGYVCVAFERAGL